MLGQILSAKAAGVALATALGVGSAAAAGALPAPVQHAASEAASQIGVSLPDPAPARDVAPPQRAALPEPPAPRVEHPAKPEPPLPHEHTTMTKPPDGAHDKLAEVRTSAVLRLTCVSETVAVICTWPLPGMGDTFALLRKTDDGPGRVLQSGLGRTPGHFRDTNVAAGGRYLYMLIGLASDGRPVAHSEPIVVAMRVTGPGFVPPIGHEPLKPSTTTTEHHETTPTTTGPAPTTTTRPVEYHDSPTTTTTSAGAHP